MDTHKVGEPFRPIFVVGFPRSGTTLLATMLSRHPRLAATPETHFMDLVVPSEDNVPAPGLHSPSHLIAQFEASPRSSDLGIDPKTLQRIAGEHETTYAQFFQSLLEYCADRAGKPRIIEKTPAHLPFVPTLLSWFPDARVVCIVRDGRDAVRSMMRQPWTHNDLRRHCRRWRRYARMTHDYEHRFADRFHTVRYEALLTNAEENLRAINEFVDEPFAPTQIDWNANPAKDTVPEWEKDWKEKAVAAPDPSRASAWRAEATDAERWLMNTAMGNELQRFGYEDTSLSGCPPHTHAWHCLADMGYNIALAPTVRPLLRRMIR